VRCAQLHTIRSMNHDESTPPCRTFFEIAAYWAQLAPGGILLGDDLNWAAVMHDAQMFTRIHQTVLNSFNGCHEQLMQARSSKGTLCVWYMQKPLI